MIEQTPEMTEAVRAATGCSTPTCHTCTVAAESAVTALLAIIKRDHDVKPRPARGATS